MMCSIPTVKSFLTHLFRWNLTKYVSWFSITREWYFRVLFLFKKQLSTVPTGPNVTLYRANPRFAIWVRSKFNFRNVEFTLRSLWVLYDKPDVRFLGALYTLIRETNSALILPSVSHTICVFQTLHKSDFDHCPFSGNRNKYKNVNMEYIDKFSSPHFPLNIHSTQDSCIEWKRTDNSKIRDTLTINVQFSQPRNSLFLLSSSPCF
jgi:hypothetical protein